MYITSFVSYGTLCDVGRNYTLTICGVAGNELRASDGGNAKKRWHYGRS